MKIRHTDGREVDGVDYIQLIDFWQKEVDGVHMCYYRAKGWSEVIGPRYVDVTGECSVLEYKTGRGVINGIRERGLGVNGTSMYLPEGYSFRRQAMFDLPDTLIHEVYHCTAKGFIEYIQRFKKPCLIVEKEES